MARKYLMGYASVVTSLAKGLFSTLLALGRTPLLAMPARIRYKGQAVTIHSLAWEATTTCTAKVGTIDSTEAAETIIYPGALAPTPTFSGMGVAKTLSTTQIRMLPEPTSTRFS